MSTAKSKSHLEIHKPGNGLKIDYFYAAHVVTDTRDCVRADDADILRFNVSTRHDGSIRHATPGAAKWAAAPLTQARTRAARPT